jgi:hypothetical protein
MLTPTSRQCYHAEAGSTAINCHESLKSSNSYIFKALLMEFGKLHEENSHLYNTFISVHILAEAPYQFILHTFSMISTEYFYLWCTFICNIKLSLCWTNYALHHESVWGSGYIDPYFIDLGTSWRWAVSFTLRPLYPREKSPWHPLEGWGPELVWTMWRKFPTPPDVSNDV